MKKGEIVEAKKGEIEKAMWNYLVHEATKNKQLYETPISNYVKLLMGKYKVEGKDQEIDLKGFDISEVSIQFRNWYSYGITIEAILPNGYTATIDISMISTWDFTKEEYLEYTNKLGEVKAKLVSAMEEAKKAEEIENLKYEKEKLERENKELKQRVKELEKRINELEGIIAKIKEALGVEEEEEDC